MRTSRAAMPPVGQPGRPRERCASLSLFAALAVAARSAPPRPPPTRGRCSCSRAPPGRPTRPPRPRPPRSRRRHGRRLHGRRDHRRDPDQRGEPRQLSRGRVRPLRGRRAQRDAGSRLQGTSRAAAASSASARRPSSRRATPLLRHADRPHRRRPHDGRERGQHAGRRVPRPRAPGHARPAALVKGRSDNYYAWATNPTGPVHTVARVRFNTIPVNRRPDPAAPSVTNDAVTRFTGTTNTIQPQRERALSWCRDVQQGRSFYTGLGHTAARTTTTLQQAPARRRPVGGRHGPRQLQGDDQLQLHGDAPDAVEPDCPGPAGATSRPRTSTRTWARSTASRWPRTGACSTPAARSASRASSSSRTGRIRTTASAAARSTCGIRASTDDDQNAAKDHEGRRLLGLRRQGRRHRVRPDGQDRARHPRHRARPGLHDRARRTSTSSTTRTTAASRAGHGHAARPGLRPRRLHGRAPPLALHLRRGDQDPRAAEKVIFRYMTQVYSCCHLGGAMDFDSKGNLYFATGDNTGNAPNSNNGGYTNGHPQYTLPCPGDADLTHLRGHRLRHRHVRSGRRPARCHRASTPLRARSQTRPRPTDGSLAACGYISLRRRAPDLGQHERLGGQAAPDQAAGQPAANNPGIGTSYTIPGADAPNGPNLFPPTARPSTTARPSLRSSPWASATCTRSTSTRRPDKIAAAWVGPDQGTNSPTGARPRPRTPRDQLGGQLRLAVLHGQPLGYRAKLPANTGGGTAPLRRASRHGRRRRRRPDGGGYWDCDVPQAVAQRLAVQHRPRADPGGEADEHLVRPAGRVLRLPAQRQRHRDLQRHEHQHRAAGQLPPLPVRVRRQPGADDGGIYRKPAGDTPNAWPSYWDGRWFLADFAGGNNIRHALLMDPATEFTGGQPVAADSLYGIIPTGADGRQPHDRSGLRSRRRAVRRRLRRIELRDQQRQHSVWRFAYIGGADTPGPDPKVVAERRTRPRDVRVQHRQVRRHLLQVGLRRRRTRHRQERHAHVRGAGNGVKPTATLTVTYADGQTVGEDDRRPGPDDGAEHGHAHVPQTLGLTIGPPATFGDFVPGVANTYARQHHGQRHLDDAERAADRRRPERARTPASWSTVTRRWPRA